MTTDLIIDESNFEQYFFDVRKHRPQKGQVMACYKAIADFVEGDLKRDIISLLLYNDKGGELAPRIFQKLACSSQIESVRVIKEITEDLISGLTIEEVLAKPYSYTFETYYYTQKEYIPMDDIHWSTIMLLNTLDKEVSEKIVSQKMD